MFHNNNIWNCAVDTAETSVSLEEHDEGHWKNNPIISYKA